MNLIDYRVESKLQTIQVKPNKIITKKSLVSLFTLFIVLFVSLFYVSQNNKAEAVEFGLGNDYEAILEMNSKFSNSVPVSMQSISTTQTSGDKRVVALVIFLEKYRSPMASTSVAKSFIESADKNGFGDKWYILPAISGMESAFGKLIPSHGNVSSFNGWGWSGGSKYGRWSYFNSWEHAVTTISAGVAKGYGVKNLTPEKMMASYCPPCALPENRGRWAKTVNGYISEMRGILESL